VTTLAGAPADAAAEVVPIAGMDRVPAEEWDRLARRGFHVHRWFAAAERCGWRGRHVAVRGTAGLRAVVPAFLTGPGTAHDLHERWLGPLGDLAARAGVGLRPILSVQPPFAQNSEPLAGPGELPDHLLHRVFAVLEREARSAGAKAVAWPYVDLTRDDLIRVARERGYAVHYAGATAWLPVRWGSFDDYLASRSKSVRRTIRAELRALAKTGLRTVLAADFEREAAEMDRLYRDAFHRRNGRPAPTPADLFERLARPAWPERLAQLTWQGDRLVGTSLNVWAHGVLDGTLAGFAAEHRVGPAYYNDLCYQPVRLACASGISAIDLGASALHAKVLRGAVLRRRVVLIRGTSPGAHRALRALGGIVARRVEAKERRALGALWGPRCFEEAVAE
jgi:predicted N-acyltransferase